MNLQELTAELEAVMISHLAEHGDGDMVMPYPLHWVIAISVADAAQEHYLNIRAVAPSAQPRYVSTGLLNESIEMMNWGDPDATYEDE